MNKPALLLINLGTPNSPSYLDVFKYLREFLMDGRVIDVPSFFRFILVTLIICPIRSFASSKIYKELWDLSGGVSPLLKNTEELTNKLNSMQNKYDVPVYNSESGYSVKGIDLGSNNFRINKPVKVALLIGEGVNSYEAGEVWHLLDTRIGLPLTKLKLSQFSGISLKKYTTLIMVSGSYNQLGKDEVKKMLQIIPNMTFTINCGIFPEHIDS